MTAATHREGGHVTIRVPKQPPLASLKQHPVHWIGQGILAIVWAVGLSRIGSYFWVAVYFHVTQNDWVKPYWHALVAWELLRHFLRDGFEYLLGTTFGWFALHSRWSWWSQRPITRVERFFDRIGLPCRAQQERTHAWQFWCWIPLTATAAIPGMALAFGAHWLSVWRSHRFGWSYQDVMGPILALPLPEVVRSYILSLQYDWHIKLAGILGGLFFGRLVFIKIASDAQRYLVERRAVRFLRARTRVERLLARPRWPLPTPYRAEFEAALLSFRKRQENDEALPSHPRWITWVQLSAVPVLLLLAYRGWWIMQYVAPHPR